MLLAAARALNLYADREDIIFQITVITSVVSGFLITVVLRIIYRRLKQSDLPPSTMVLSVISCIVISALLLSAIDTWIVLQTFFIDVQIYEFVIGRALYDLFVLLIWTGAYFIVNYHFLLLEQKEMYLQAVAQAHQSQLQMLRYQINPHFLFNTLNAISTLVLEKQTKAANGMLTKLSAFLRFSLVNQPTQKITLDEEVYALWLYLDIEKVRFEDRLSINFNVSDEVKKALIPSLLLQPLVENAIKYAIAPMESGGTISIYASQIEDRLCIKLCDTGPGMSDQPIKHKFNESSSGVGLENTKNRLKQLYPDDHTIDIKNRDEGGLQIDIEIPFEIEKGLENAE